MMIGKTGIFTIFGFHYSEYVVVLRDHVHMHIEYPPKLAIAKIVNSSKDARQECCKPNIRI